MKGHWFHLMPYKYLPEDFQDRYHSVWVDVPSELYDPVKGHETYNEYLDELEYADRVGFDGICVNEHHANAYGLMPSPNIMLACLARRTTNAALVVLGNSIALYNPPLRVAEEMAMLDVISGGRFIAGFPVGSSMDTNFAYGQTPATLRDKYYEAHDLIIKAWTTPEPFIFNGKFNQFRYVNVWPRPIQKPHPPVWIPGGGSVETWDWVAQHDYMYAYLSYFGYQPARETMKGFWEAVDRAGRDPNPYRAGYLQLIAISDSDAKAEAEYAEAAYYFYHRCLHVPTYFALAPGYMTLKSIKSLKTPFSFEFLKGLTWKDFVDQGYIIAGSPATVRERLRDVLKDMNVGQVMTLCQFGNLGREQTMRNTALYAKEVMPYLKDLWKDWEDRWYPKPLDSQHRVKAAAL
ncbi:MAG: LLM class flavin-dependent oxidoreductase [Deltaproteobacteria bacterium]|nr:LLM class flavin-dependent oxidoreductase [Deltaproteobacteria bacterium]